MQTVRVRILKNKKILIQAIEDTNKKSKWNNKKTKTRISNRRGGKCADIERWRSEKHFLRCLTWEVWLSSLARSRLEWFVFPLFFRRMYFICAGKSLLIQFNNNKPFCLALFIQFQLQSCFISVMLLVAHPHHKPNTKKKSLQSVMYCKIHCIRRFDHSWCWFTWRLFYYNSCYLLVLFELAKKMYV